MFEKTSGLGGTRASHSDTLGLLASSLCVAHCIITPLLLSSSAVLAHALPSEEETHRLLALCVTLLGSVAILRGFRRHHCATVIALMASGVTLVCTSACFSTLLPSHAFEVAITTVGSLFLIAAHRLNHTFCQSCTCACIPPSTEFHSAKTTSL